MNISEAKLVISNTIEKISAGENISEDIDLSSKFVEAVTLMMKNVDTHYFDMNKNKCHISCPFFTNEHRNECNQFRADNNCYQCVICEYERMKSQIQVLIKDNEKLIEKNQRCHEIIHKIIDKS